VVYALCVLSEMAETKQDAKILYGFEGFLTLGYKTPVPTSQETSRLHYRAQLVNAM
jgi:hypothetical protein